MANSPLNAERRKPSVLPKRIKYHNQFPIESWGKTSLNRLSKNNKEIRLFKCLYHFCFSSNLYLNYIIHKIVNII